MSDVTQCLVSQVKFTLDIVSGFSSSRICHSKTACLYATGFLNKPTGDGIILQGITSSETSACGWWSSQNVKCWYTIKNSLLKHIRYAKDQHTQTVPVPLTLLLLHGCNPSRLHFHTCSCEYWDQHALHSGSYVTFFSAWWMCILHQSDKSHYLMINHPL